MRVARVAAQAKVNLLLHVMLRDDATGYHHILTVFHRIDLADDIVLRAGGRGRTIDVAGPQLPREGLGPGEKNLAYRAAVEFAQRAGWPQGFSIELTKHIPVGGGLGGGSADAGAVLRALNALAPKPLTEDELWSAACVLGSDVPFLTKEWVRAFGSHRGTNLTEVPDLSLPPMDVVIVVPGFSVATADAYRWLDEDRAKSGAYPFTTNLAIVPGDVTMEADEPPPGFVNHFEPVVEARYPELRQIREQLGAKGAVMARLAGSGSCVCGVFRDTPPSDSDLGLDALVIRTRLSSRVVQVEVLE
jgi:4-diphosphocytidyl-2-C-methyl-D-erythritol kinase